MTTLENTAAAMNAMLVLFVLVSFGARATAKLDAVEFSGPLVL